VIVVHQVKKSERSKAWERQILDHLQKMRNEGRRAEAPIGEFTFLAGYSTDFKTVSRANQEVRRRMESLAREKKVELQLSPDGRPVKVMLETKEEKEQSQLLQSISQTLTKLRSWEKPFISGADGSFYCVKCSEKFSDKAAFEKHNPCREGDKIRVVESLPV